MVKSEAVRFVIVRVFPESVPERTSSMLKYSVSVVASFIIPFVKNYVYPLTVIDIHPVFSSRGYTRAERTSRKSPIEL